MLRERWPVWLVYSVFMLKAMNSVIIRLDWWEEIECWHIIADQWCYERFWYFTFTYRRWEMIVPAILLVWEKTTKTGGLNKWVYITLLTFYVYELAEYWLIYNKVNKIWVSLAVVAICMAITFMNGRKK